jgi:hypothetical protein
MKHARVKLGEFAVPLIGVPVKEGVETCDGCGKQFPFQEIEFTGESWLCAACKKQTEWDKKPMRKKAPGEKSTDFATGSERVTPSPAVAQDNGHETLHPNQRRLASFCPDQASKAKSEILGKPTLTSSC